MAGQLQATDVTYMRLSGDRGWQKHAKLHSVAFTAASHDSAVLTVAETETQRQRECLSLPRDIVQASLNGSSTLRLTARGTPLRKIALTFSSAGELDVFAKRIHALTRVRGIEQLPGPCLTTEAAMAAQMEPLPDLSAPVVQAYAARLLFDDRFHEFVCQLGEFFCGLTARLPASTASVTGTVDGTSFISGQESGQKRKRGAGSEALDDNDTHEHAAAEALATEHSTAAANAAAAAAAAQQSGHSESVLQPRSLMNSATIQHAQVPATPSSAAQPSSAAAAQGGAAAPASVTPAAGYLPMNYSLQQQQQQQQQQQLVNHHRTAAAAAVTPAAEADLTPPDAVRSSMQRPPGNSFNGAGSAAGSAAVTRVHSPRAVYPQQQQQLAEAQRQQARMQQAAQQQQQQAQRQYQHQLQLQQLQRQQQQLQQQFMRPQAVTGQAQQAQRHGTLQSAPQPTARKATLPPPPSSSSAAAAVSLPSNSSAAAAPAVKRTRGRPAKNAADSQASVVSQAAAVPSVRKSAAERFSAAVVGARTPREERAALYAELKSLWEAVYVLEDCWPFRKPVKPNTPGYKVSMR
jgi:hypothetical protein